jgi:hypothetical protein
MNAHTNHAKHALGIAEDWTTITAGVLIVALVVVYIEIGYDLMMAPSSDMVRDQIMEALPLESKMTLQGSASKLQEIFTPELKREYKKVLAQADFIIRDSKRHLVIQ